MNKKGFTLIELLAVVIILAVIGLLIIPVINNSLKGSKEKLYQTQISNIETGLKNWASENVFSLPAEGNQITMTLGDLKTAGFVDKDIKNPKTEELFNDNMILIIENRNGEYIYIVTES